MAYDPTPIPYAAVAPKPAGRAWAGTAIVIGGLVLVGLAGCFLIGVMTVVNSNVVFGVQGTSAKPLTDSQVVFVTVLYTCTLVSFIGAGVMLFIGVRSLLRLLAGG